MNKSTFALGLAVVAIVIAAFGTFHSYAPSFGNKTASFWDATLGYYVNGVAVINSSGIPTGPSSGTCSLIATSFTVAASTTVSMDCAVTGVVSGDIVFAQFATSTTNGNGWTVGSVSASTTSGFITLRVNNWTGASGIIPASVASTTQYSFYR